MRPDPRQTVIINVTRLTVNNAINFTRQFAMCSVGDTKIEVGSTVDVNSGNYVEIFDPDTSYKNTPTYRFLNNYFISNVNGSVMVLELGHDPAHEHTLDELVGEWETKTEPIIKGRVELSPLNKKSRAVSDVKLIIAYEGQDQATIPLGVSTEPISKTIDIMEVAPDLGIKGSITISGLGTIVYTPALDNTKPAPFDIGFTLVPNAPAMNTPVEILDSFIQTTTRRVYMYCVPNALYGSSELVSLVAKYADFNAGQYFMIVGDANENLNSSIKYEPYKKLKSVFYVAPSSKSNESPAGAIMGIMSSGIYDLSVTNPLSLLQYKLVKGITPNEPDNAIAQGYIDNGANWISKKGDNIMIYGGTMADGTGWEFYYALDNYLFSLGVALENAIVNGANNPRQAIGLNQLGIDKMKGICKNISNNFIQYKAIADFGTGRDLDNIITGSGDFGAIDFITYKRQSPADASNGIYTGLFADIDFQVFMVQVRVNIGIN